jgi:hypothetical protein
MFISPSHGLDLKVVAASRRCTEHAVRGLLEKPCVTSSCPLLLSFVSSTQKQFVSSRRLQVAMRVAQ